MGMINILHGDCIQKLREMPALSIQTCVTSPPYWGLRDYGVDGQIGLEQTPGEWLDKMIEVFREVRRVLRDDGTIWVNIGDSYAGSGRGGAPTEASSTLEGGHNNQKASAIKRTREPNEIGATSRDSAVTNIARRQTRLEGNFKQKDLMMMPARLAIALQEDGLYLRSDIIWAKPNPMPESVTDRPTKSHEHIFLFSKSPTYYYDADAIREECVWDLDGNGTTARAERASTDHKAMPDERKNGIRPRTRPAGWATGKDHTALGWANEKNQGRGRAGISAPGYDEKKWDKRHDGVSRPPMTMTDREYNPLGRNKRDVWTIATQPFSEAHFATFPPKLIEPCILAGCPVGGTVLDPFFGAGTTGLVADRLQRNCIGLELNREYIAMAEKRLRADSSLFSEIKVS